MNRRFYGENVDFCHKSPEKQAEIVGMMRFCFHESIHDLTNSSKTLYDKKKATEGDSHETIPTRND